MSVRGGNGGGKYASGMLCKERRKVSCRQRQSLIEGGAMKGALEAEMNDMGWFMSKR